MVEGKEFSSPLFIFFAMVEEDMIRTYHVPGRVIHNLLDEKKKRELAGDTHRFATLH